MNNNQLLKWIFANAFGLGIGFILFLQIGMTLRYGFNMEKYWKFGQPWDYSLWEYMRRLISSFVLGAFVGFVQYSIVKSINANIRLSPWVSVTAIGFCLLTITVDWPLLYMEFGNLPGPLDPIIVTVGGGIFAGVAQYFYLRRKGILAKKWLLLWLTGLVLSLIPTALFFTFIGDHLKLSWPMEVFISGFLVAGVAAWISGNAFFSALSVDKNR